MNRHRLVVGGKWSAVIVTWLGLVGPARAAPTALVTDQHDLSAIAADADSLYWSAGGGINKVAKKGGKPTVLVAGIRYGYVPLAIDADSVYFVADSAIGGGQPLDAAGGIVKVPKLGGKAVRLAPDPDQATAIAVDDSGVYWLDPGEDMGRGGPSQTGGIWWVAKSGGKAKKLAKIHNGRGLVIDGDLLYFGQHEALFSLPKKGGKPRAIAGAGEPVASGAAGIYAVQIIWKKVSGGVTDDGDQLVLVARGKKSKPVAVGPKQVGDISTAAADGGSLYFVVSKRGEVPQGTLKLLPAAGGEPKTVAEGLEFPIGALAIDAGALYVATLGKGSGHGQILKIAR
jgi:hypothetical protein